MEIRKEHILERWWVNLNNRANNPQIQPAPIEADFLFFSTPDGSKVAG